MAEIFWYEDFNADKFAILLNMEGETIGQKIENEIARLSLNGMSEEAIVELFVNDFQEGGRIFGPVLNLFKSTIGNGLNDIVQNELFRGVGEDELLIWVTTSGNPCEECFPRHGQKKTRKEWEAEGLPGSGFSRCNYNDMCVLLPEGNVPEDFGDPVEIPPLSEVRKDFQERLKTDPGLQAKLAGYN